MAVTFNGTERFIEVTDPSDVVLDAQQDIYSAWKDWAQASTINAGFSPALRTFGGDTTVPGQNAPRYYFLINGWRVRINNGVVVQVSLNLYSEDYISPYVIISGSGVSDRNSDAVNVNEDDIRSQSFLNAQVTLDTGDGVAGTIYPIGTPPRPSDNLPDALIIMHNEGLHKIGLTGFVTATATESLQQVKITGQSGSSNIVVLSGTNTDQADFEKLIIAGAFDGLSRIIDCIVGTTGLGGMTGVQGRIKDSIINHVDGVVQESGGAGTLFDNCSFVTPNDQQVTLDANGEGFGLRDCTGNILITNVTKAEALQVHLIGAVVELDSSCTAGTITFTGSGVLTDNSGGTTVINNLIASGTDAWTVPEKDKIISDVEIIKDQSELSALNAIEELNK